MHEQTLATHMLTLRCSATSSARATLHRAKPWKKPLSRFRSTIKYNYNINPKNDNACKAVLTPLGNTQALQSPKVQTLPKNVPKLPSRIPPPAVQNRTDKG
eukprot:2534808-Amphidinium_carterae.1